MKIKNFRLVKNWYVLAAIVGIVILVPNQVFAVDAITSTIGDLVWGFFVYPMIWALNLLLELLKLVASYNNFTKEGGVTIGWVALRDLSNMFFILIFLVIAFSTILRISSYGYNQLLRRTIIIAILINFSKTIVGFIIDVSQVVMLTFIAAVNQALTGGVVVAVGLYKFTTINAQAAELGYSDYVVSLVMGAILVAILLVVIGIMVMMLMMRIVALWVAIVMAPLAFLADIFPATRSFYNTWLKQLGSNLVTGPMLAFFLWLTFTIVGNGNAYSTFMNEGASASEGATEFLNTTNLVNYIIAISLLLMGIKVAANSGAAGANFASKGMGMIKSTAGKLARKYPGAMARRAGAFAAGALVDKEGKAKHLSNFANTKFGRLTRLNKLSDKYQEKRASLRQSDNMAKRGIGRVMSMKWNQLPYYGTQVQRGAMELKGKNAAIAARERAEKSKNIPAQMREEFFRVGSSMPDKVLGSKTVGKALQIASSWGGGHFEDKKGWAEAKVDRNTIQNKTEAKEVAQQLEREFDETRTDKLHKQWASTYINDEQVDKDLNEYGFKNIIKDQKEEAALDENGNVEEGTERFWKGAGRDKDVAGFDIFAGLMSLQKRIRGAWTESLRQVTMKTLPNLAVDENALKSSDDEAREEQKKKLVLKTTTNEKLGLETVRSNEKSALEINPDNDTAKFSEGGLVYPQMFVEPINAMTAQMEGVFRANAVMFDENEIDNLPPRAGENDNDYRERKKETTKEWRQAWTDFNKVADPHWEKYQNGEISKEQYYNNISDARETLATKTRQLRGVYTDEEVAAEAPAIKDRLRKAKEDWENGDIDTKRYKEIVAEDEGKLQDMTSSPLLRLKGDESDKEIAQLLRKHMEPMPERKEAKVEEVTDEEIDQRVKQKVASMPQSKIVDASGRPKQVVATDEIRAEAKSELEAEKKNKQQKEQKKYDKEYDKEVSEYSEKWDKLPDEIEKKLKEINTDSDAQTLDKVTLDIANENAKTESERDMRLLVDLTAKQNTLIRTQNKKRREALGLETSNTRNFFNRAILKNATDGFDYSRLQEMPIQEGPVRELFKELTRVATQDQQRQMLNASNQNQIELFARTMVPTGQKLNKSIMDNLPQNLKEDLWKTMWQMKFMKEGMSELEAKLEVANVKDLSKIK